MNLGIPRYGYFLLAILAAIFGHGFGSAIDCLFSPEFVSNLDGICVAFTLGVGCLFSYIFTITFIVYAVFGKDHEL